MKLSLSDRKNLLLIVLAVVILGALLHREFPLAGLIVTLVGIGFYLAVNTSVIIRFLLHLKQTSVRQRVKIGTFTVLLYIFISAIVTRSVYYFLLLSVLATDYLIYDKTPAKNE